MEGAAIERRGAPPTLPEVSEAEASGEIADLYRDIGESLDIVNLIYRHLATVDGALSWAWRTVEAPIKDGTIAGVAGALTLEPRASRVSAIPAEARSFLDLDAEAIAEIRDILHVYRNANRVNLVSLQYWRSSLGGRSIRPSQLATTTSGGAASRSGLPPLSSVADMPPDVRRLLFALGDVTGGGGVVPSLFRHLSPWPRLLALTLHVLSSDGHAEAVRTDAQALLEHLSEQLTAPGTGPAAAPSPSEPARRHIEATIDRFSWTIPAMLIVIECLEDLLAARPRSSS